MRLHKRSGNIEKFSAEKIKRSLLMAFNATGTIPNTAPLVRDVLGRLDPLDLTVTAASVGEVVENVLMDAGWHDAARHYILERRRGAALPGVNAGLRDYVVVSKYARYGVGRRETWDEICTRVGSFLGAPSWVIDGIRSRRWVGSMRGMQFAGDAVSVHNARLYNCSFTLIDRWRVFQEVFYLLLCGCGVGYSVQWQHVDKLGPVLSMNGPVRHYTVADTIEGWADAVGALIEAATVTGERVEFNYSLIRDEGMRLRVSGGRAPGHLPLKQALEELRSILIGAAGRRIRPIEASDMLCLLALGVLAGGIRRSSLLGLFSPDDTEMIYAKARGVRVPCRDMVNLSAALLRTGDRLVFDRLMRVASENYGDPGFCFLDDLDTGPNPCGEIIMNPVLDGATGFGFCNLSEINMALVNGEGEFLRACEATAILGTLQASYTSFPYLGEVTAKICRRDALLGVSMTGMTNNRALSFDGALLRRGAARVLEVNAEWAARLGINVAKRATCVKPSGTSSLVLGCIGAGIHPMWAPRFLRRVTANPLEATAREFRRVNPHMVEEKPNGDWCLLFPIEGAGACVSGTAALSFVDDVLNVYDNWVVPGGRSGAHNVSCSVTVRDSELASVVDKMWEARGSLCAMTIIPPLKGRFAYAPMEVIGVDRWNYLISNYRPVDWENFEETMDTTSMRGTAACAGGVCEV